MLGPVCLDKSRYRLCLGSHLERKQSSQLSRFSGYKADGTGLQNICQVDGFPWGHRFVCPAGSDHGTFNFIRLLDKDIDENHFQAIVDTQEPVFHKYRKTLSVKISDSVFSTPPDFLAGYQVAGTPLTSILIDHKYLPSLPARESMISSPVPVGAMLRAGKIASDICLSAPSLADSLCTAKFQGES